LALNSLLQALTLAESQGYVRLFVDDGLPMAELLSLAISQNISSGYAARLLAVFPKDVLCGIPVAEERRVDQQNLMEPLTEREVEVLRLIAEGRKYEEIAEKLIISINTVRYHTRNVYGKLEVNSRTQAVRRAKELNLL
jgi:LuxR family maltose regulon positive regulatory protein